MPHVDMERDTIAEQAEKLGISPDQRAFDVAFRHVETMDAPACEVGGRCVYWSHREGLPEVRCPIGAMLPETAARSLSTVQDPVETILREFDSVSSHLEGVNPGLLIDLQKAHDQEVVLAVVHPTGASTHHSVSKDWRSRMLSTMRDIAGRYELRTSREQT